MDILTEHSEDRSSSCSAEGASFSSLVEKGEVKILFQPILDISQGQVLGFEAFSRGDAPVLSARDLFSQGHREGMTWELEVLCRSEAMRRIRQQNWQEGWRLFMNVSPEVFLDHRFPAWLAEELLSRESLKASSIVLEMTGARRDIDFQALSSVLDTVRPMGFQVAQDDLGGRNEGLPALVQMRPDFIKLDRFLIADIQEDVYRQNLVKSFIDFSERVNALAVAEGVEKWQELECLVRMGVRYFQGFLLGRPAPDPLLPAPGILNRARDVFRRFNPEEGGRLQGDRARSLVCQCRTVHPGEMTGEQIDSLFRKNVELNHIVVIDEDRRALGLVTRQDFFRKTGGAFGYHLFQRQGVVSLAKKEFLSVCDQTSIQMLSTKAMERSRDDLYDPVVVFDDRGCFCGTITMKQIITRSSELEVELALNSNPLTGLPGNRHIEKWIMDSLELRRDFTIIYADLDRFKEYNDRYGFIQGDQLICLTGEILRVGVNAFPVGTKLGHVGGDDFVLVCPGLVNEEHLKEICFAFDKEKQTFFSQDDLSRGFYEGEDRCGKRVQVRLVTLSLAVVESRQLGESVHPGELTEIAASLKHRVKQITAERLASAYCFERRNHSGTAAMVP